MRKVPLATCPVFIRRTWEGTTHSSPPGPYWVSLTLPGRTVCTWFQALWSPPMRLPRVVDIMSAFPSAAILPAAAPAGAGLSRPGGGQDGGAAGRDRGGE